MNTKKWLIVAILILLVLTTLSVDSALAGGNKNGQIKICHAHPPDKFGDWNVQHPDKNGIVGGHDGHSADIIPPFEYILHGEVKFYPGKNWVEIYIVIYKNDCVKPSPTATPVTPTNTPVPPTNTPVPPTETSVPPTATPGGPTPTATASPRPGTPTPPGGPTATPGATSTPQKLMETGSPPQDPTALLRLGIAIILVIAGVFGWKRRH